MASLYARLNGHEPQKRGISAAVSASGLPIGGEWTRGDITLRPAEMVNAALERGITMKTDAEASLDLVIRNQETLDPIPNHPAAMLWNRRPNPHMDARRFRKIILRRLQRHGQAFCVIDRGPTGEGPPLQLAPIFDQVRVVIDDVKDPLQPAITGFQVGRNRLGLMPQEVLWLSFVNGETVFDFVSPAAIASYPTKLDAYAREWQLGELRNGARPSGLLRLGDVDERQRESIKAQMRQSTMGPSNAGKIVTLSGAAAQNADFSRISLTPEEMSYIESRHMNAEEIYLALGIPVDLMQGKTTYDNVRAAKTALWSETLVPEIEDIASAVEFQLVNDVTETAWFDTSKVEALRESENDLFKRITSAVLAEVPTLGQARLKLGFDLKNDESDDMTFAEYRSQLGIAPSLGGHTPGGSGSDGSADGGGTAFHLPALQQHATPVAPPPAVAERGVTGQTTVALPMATIKKAHEDARSRMLTLLQRQGADIHDHVIAAGSMPGDAILSADSAAHKAQLRALARAAMTSTARTAGQKILDAIHSQRATNPKQYEPSADLSSYIDDQSDMTGDSMSSTTQDELAKKIDDMEAEGTDLAAISAMILGYFSATGRAGERADQFAIQSTYPTANRASREAAALDNAAEARQWSTANDDRVDADCAPLEGETASLDGPYPNGAEPGDVHFGCRCSELYVLRDFGELSKPEPKFYKVSHSIPVTQEMRFEFEYATRVYAASAAEKVIDRMEGVLRNRAKRKKLNGRLFDDVYWTYQLSEALAFFYKDAAEEARAFVALGPETVDAIDGALERMRERVRAITTPPESVPNG